MLSSSEHMELPRTPWKCTDSHSSAVPTPPPCDCSLSQKVSGRKISEKPGHVTSHGTADFAGMTKDLDGESVQLGPKCNHRCLFIKVK
jgi:hypothetical protein